MNKQRTTIPGRVRLGILMFFLAGGLTFGCSQGRQLNFSRVWGPDRPKIDESGDKLAGLAGRDSKDKQGDELARKDQAKKNLPGALDAKKETLAKKDNAKKETAQKGGWLRGENSIPSKVARVFKRKSSADDRQLAAKEGRDKNKKSAAGKDSTSIAANDHGARDRKTNLRAVPTAKDKRSSAGNGSEDPFLASAMDETRPGKQAAAVVKASAQDDTPDWARDVHDEFSPSVADKQKPAAQDTQANLIADATPAAKARPTFARNFRDEMEKLRAEMERESLLKGHDDPIESLALDAVNDPADKHENLDLPEMEQARQPIVAQQTGKQAPPMPDRPGADSSPFGSESAAVAQTQQIARPQVVPREERQFNPAAASQHQPSTLAEHGQVAHSHLIEADAPQYNLAAQNDLNAAENELDDFDDEFESSEEPIDEPAVAAEQHRPIIRPMPSLQSMQQPPQPQIAQQSRLTHEPLTAHQPQQRQMVPLQQRPIAARPQPRQPISIASGSGIPRGLLHADDDANGMIIDSDDLISRFEIRERTQQLVLGVSLNGAIDDSAAGAPTRMNTSMSGVSHQHGGLNRATAVEHGAVDDVASEDVENGSIDSQAAPQLLNRNEAAADRGEQLAAVDVRGPVSGPAGLNATEAMPVEIASPAAISSATNALHSATDALHSATTALGSATATLDSASSTLNSASTNIASFSVVGDDAEAGDGDDLSEGVHIGTPGWVLIGGICLSCLVALYVRRRQPGRI